MKRRLQDELQQTKPFSSLEQEVYLELVHTSEVATRWVIEALRASDLTAPQFNVLRILKGAGDAGHPCGQIAERMVNHDPDLTRLLDRLEARGLVEKSRDTKDRRVVNARITEAGLDAVARASEDVTDRLRNAMGPMGAPQLEQLADLLESLRAGATEALKENGNPNQAGGSDGQAKGPSSRHGSDRKAGRSDRAGAARQGRARAGDDAQDGRTRSAGAQGARRGSRRG
jgi:DNA-binding MarR family transcriptional regulator